MLTNTTNGELMTPHLDIFMSGKTMGLNGLRFHDIYDVYCTHSDIAAGYLQGQLETITLANNTIDLPFQ